MKERKPKTYTIGFVEKEKLCHIFEAKNKSRSKTAVCGFKGKVDVYPGYDFKSHEIYSSNEAIILEIFQLVIISGFMHTHGEYEYRICDKCIVNFYGHNEP